MWAPVHQGATVAEYARVVGTPEPGSPRCVKEPMDHSTLPTQESIDKQLIEEILTLPSLSLGKGAAERQVCGEKHRVGAPVVEFVFRFADQPVFDIGQINCTEHRYEFPGGA